MKILILVNTLTSVNSFIYSNHINFIAHNIRKYPEKNSIFFFAPNRMPIDMARNIAARQALELDCDYLMFIDDDVFVPPDALEKLIALEADIAAGLVIIRGYPFHVMAFDFVENYDPENPHVRYYDHLPKHEDGSLLPVVSCAAVGFSCALIKTELLRKLEEPYFITGTNLTEDVYFCLKALETFPTVSIKMDTSIQCGHLLNAEPVEWSNIEKLKAFYKPAAESEEHPRNLAMIERCLAQI